MKIILTNGDIIERVASDDPGLTGLKVAGVLLTYEDEIEELSGYYKACIAPHMIEGTFDVGFIDFVDKFREKKQ